MLRDNFSHEMARVMALASKARILIVEDDPSVAQLQCRRLESAGYEVVIAATVEEALALAQTRKVDLAIVDYCLHDGITGLNLFEQFKASDLSLPVIIVTAFSEEETVIKALRAGVSDFVPKTAAYLDYLPDAIDRVLKQVRVEKQLAESEARFASFMDHSSAVAYIKDEQLRLLFVNRLGQRMFNLADYVGKTASDLLPPDVADRIHDDELKVLRTGQSTERIHTAPLPDGTMRHWLAHRFPIYDTAGRRTLGGLALDVTERVLAEEALRNSEERFRSVSESATDAIIATDQHARVISWNRSAGDMFGYASEEMLGQNIERIIPPRFRDAQRAGLERLRVNSHGALRGARQELYGLRKDGSEFPIELSVGDWKHAGERFFSGIVRDVTDKKRAEEELRKRDEQLQHSQKMHALGTLAGGVAHEFNNLLQSIRGYTRYAMEDLDPQDRSFKDLEVVLQAAERAETLTRQLLGFGRRQMLQYADLDPNQVVADSVRMLRPLIDAHIHLELVLGEGIGTVHADATHLQQLLMNLCINARDAMPDGGHLLIKTESMMLDEEASTAYPDLAPGMYLALTVSDTGCGMTSEVLQQAFDPFYTTKEVGKGTGLGLATIYGVVAQHKGTVRVYSDPGVGTAFKIFLPTVDRQAGQAMTPASAHKARSGETILVAEDEQLVRKLVTRALTSAGFRTLEAADGSEAVGVFDANAPEISLVLLDVMMPRMNGHDTFEHMRRLKPDLKVIFTSAYDAETAQLGFIDQRGLRFLQKPFEGDELLHIVRDVLDCQPAVVEMA